MGLSAMSGGSIFLTWLQCSFCHPFFAQDSQKSSLLITLVQKHPLGGSKLFRMAHFCFIVA